MKLYNNVKFSDLFDSERQAVVCFLSLERRYMELCKVEHEEKAAERYRLAREEAIRINSLLDFAQEKRLKNE
jgi:hypothetical protein